MQRKEGVADNLQPYFFEIQRYICLLQELQRNIKMGVCQIRNVLSYVIQSEAKDLGNLHLMHSRFFHPTVVRMTKR